MRLAGSAVQLVLVVRTRDGGATQLRPPVPTAGAEQVLSVRVPPAARGGRIIALQVQLPSAEQRAAAHHGAEGTSTASGFTGNLALGRISAVTPAGAVALPALAGWRGHGGVSVRARGGSLAIHYVIDTSQQAVLRPASRSTAAVCPLSRARTSRPARARIARSSCHSAARSCMPAWSRWRRASRRRRMGATASSSPTKRRSPPALGADDLPSSIPDELWLSAPPAALPRIADALRQPPFAALATSSRAAIHGDLQRDPIARGIVSSLVAAAIAALALALLGVALATLGFLRDEADTLFDLETQGAGPRALRACVRWRALGLAVLGVLAGVALGIALAVATGRLLALDATLAVPDPPLQRITPWLTIAAAAAALAAFAAALVEASLHVAYRRSAAGRGATGEQWAE